MRMWLVRSANRITDYESIRFSIMKLNRQQRRKSIRKLALGDCERSDIESDNEQLMRAFGSNFNEIKPMTG